MNPKTTSISCSGYSIAADWYEGSTEEIMLVLPGYSSTKARQRDMTTAILGVTNYSALVIDYSGHGDSPFELGDTMPAQHFLEVIHAFDWLKTTYSNAKISVLGSSYGGFLATQLTKYRSFDKLVLKVPAIYRPEAFYDPWSLRLDSPEEYNVQSHAYRTDAQALAEHPLLARASSFAGNTLVVVHDEDELVPKETTDAFIRAFDANNFTELNFAHSVGEVTNETRVTPKQLHAYQMKIANWLVSPGPIE